MRKNPKNDSFLRFFKSDLGSARTRTSCGIAGGMGASRTREIARKIPNFSASSWYNFLLLAIVLFGIFLRLKGLIINPSMWHDECALGWNIKFKNYSDFFGILRFMQMAPPFFMAATKLITKIFGFSDISLRILPFLAGISSIIAFYFLALKTLNTRFVVLCAVFFFAINQQLINYSFEFKPYSLDVLFTIICLLFFINLNIEKLSLKKAFLYGLLLSIVPWFSFVSAFIIAGGFLNLGFKNIKYDWKKKVFLILPILLGGLVYLKIYLVSNYTGTHMVNYWQNNFVTANPFFFLYLLAENIKYFFFPIQYVLFSLILLIWGVIIFYREKSSFINISVASFILLIIASFLRFYPFFGRLVLFLVPIFLLLILKPLDLVSFNKKFKLFIIFFLTFFTLCPQIIQTIDFIQTRSISKGESPREMTENLVKNLKKNDIIFVSNSANTEFAYYSSFYNIKNQIIQEPQHSNTVEVLNSLKKGQNYWFYITFGNPKSILDWIDKNAEVIKIIHPEKTNDYLIYMKITPLTVLVPLWKQNW